MLTKQVISGNNHFISRLQSFHNFVILRVLAANTNRTAASSPPFFVHDIHILSATCLIKASTGNDHCLNGITQLQIQVVGLSGTDIFRSGGDEMQVGSKLPFSHFRVDFRYFHIVFFPLPFKTGGEIGHDTLHVVFVDLGFHFQFGCDYLPDALTLSDGLAYLSFQVS